MFKFIFGKRKAEVVIRDTPVELQDNGIEMGNVKSPVMEFVGVYKSNPRRFKIKVDLDSLMYDRKKYSVVDRVTNESFVLSTYGTRTGMFKHFPLTWNLDWISLDEVKYIINEISEISSMRQARLFEIKKLRLDRNLKVARDRLTKIYTIAKESK